MGPKTDAKNSSKKCKIAESVDDAHGHGQQQPMDTELAEHISCPLCGDFLSDAVTLTGCLHFFCRCCLLRHLASAKPSAAPRCPKCYVQLGPDKPFYRSDRGLQELVYKLVPNLFWRQLRRIARSRNADKTLSERQRQQRQRLLQISSQLCSPDEKVSIQLDYVPLCEVLAANRCQERDSEAATMPSTSTSEGQPTMTKADAPNTLFRRFFRCSARVRVEHLKRLMELKLTMNDAYGVYFVDGELRNVLEDDYTLEDIIYLYNWSREGPLQIRFTLARLSPEEEDRPPVLEEMPQLEVEGGEPVAVMTTDKVAKEADVQLKKTDGTDEAKPSEVTPLPTTPLIATRPVSIERQQPQQELLPSTSSSTPLINPSSPMVNGITISGKKNNSKKQQTGEQQQQQKKRKAASKKEDNSNEGNSKKRKKSEVIAEVKKPEETVVGTKEEANAVSMGVVRSSKEQVKIVEEQTKNLEPVVKPDNQQHNQNVAQQQKQMTKSDNVGIAPPMVNGEVVAQQLPTVTGFGTTTKSPPNNNTNNNHPLEQSKAAVPPSSTKSSGNKRAQPRKSTTGPKSTAPNTTTRPAVVAPPMAGPHHQQQHQMPMPASTGVHHHHHPNGMPAFPFQFPHNAYAPFLQSLLQPQQHQQNGMAVEAFNAIANVLLQQQQQQTFAQGMQVAQNVVQQHQQQQLCQMLAASMVQNNNNNNNHVGTAKKVSPSTQHQQQHQSKATSTTTTMTPPNNNTKKMMNNNNKNGTNANRSSSSSTGAGAGSSPSKATTTTLPTRADRPSMVGQAPTSSVRSPPMPSNNVNTNMVASSAHHQCHTLQNRTATSLASCASNVHNPHHRQQQPRPQHPQHQQQSPPSTNVETGVGLGMFNERLVAATAVLKATMPG